MHRCAGSGWPLCGLVAEWLAKDEEQLGAVRALRITSTLARSGRVATEQDVAWYHANRQAVPHNDAVAAVLGQREAELLRLRHERQGELLP